MLDFAEVIYVDINCFFYKCWTSSKLGFKFGKFNICN